MLANRWDSLPLPLVRATVEVYAKYWRHQLATTDKFGEQALSAFATPNTLDFDIAGRELLAGHDDSFSTLVPVTPRRRLTTMSNIPSALPCPGVRLEVKSPTSANDLARSLVQYGSFELLGPGYGQRIPAGGQRRE